MTVERWIIVVLMLLLMEASALTANKNGMQPEGTLIPGNLVIVGTTPNDLKDGGPPGQNKTITIGDTINGSTPNSCLTSDTNNKLQQTNCLLAH